MVSITPLIFITFSAIYALISAAVVYHLKEYTLPVERAPKIVTAIFLVLSGILWLIGLFLVLV